MQLANVNASLGVIAFANGDMELCKQLLFLAVKDSSACPEAVFIMAGLGIVAGDSTLTQAALGKGTCAFCILLELTVACVV